MILLVILVALLLAAAMVWVALSYGRQVWRASLARPLVARPLLLPLWKTGFFLVAALGYLSVAVFFRGLLS